MKTSPRKFNDSNLTTVYSHELNSLERNPVETPAVGSEMVGHNAMKPIVVGR